MARARLALTFAVGVVRARVVEVQTQSSTRPRPLTSLGARRHPRCTGCRRCRSARGWPGWGSSPRAGVVPHWASLGRWTDGHLAGRSARRSAARGAARRAAAGASAGGAAAPRSRCLPELPELPPGPAARPPARPRRIRPAVGGSQAVLPHATRERAVRDGACDEERGRRRAGANGAWRSLRPHPMQRAYRAREITPTGREEPTRCPGPWHVGRARNTCGTRARTGSWPGRSTPPGSGLLLKGHSTTSMRASFGPKSAARVRPLHPSPPSQKRWRCREQRPRVDPHALRRGPLARPERQALGALEGAPPHLPRRLRRDASSARRAPRSGRPRCPRGSTSPPPRTGSRLPHLGQRDGVVGLRRPCALIVSSPLRA